MRSYGSVLGLVVLIVASVVSFAQTPAALPTSAASIPRLIRFAGVARNTDGTARAGVVGVTFLLFTDQTGGTPLWQEIQNVTFDANGRYSVLLGANSKDGIPAELFTSNEARWLGVQVEQEPEQARVLLVSVPYALKAGDAETLGGRRITDFVLAPTAVDSTASSSGSTSTAAQTANLGAVRTNSVISAASIGTQNFLAKWIDNAGTLGNSAIFEDANGFVGIGTNTPGSKLDVQATTSAPLNIINSTMTLTNSSPISSDVVTALKLNVIDASTATNVSKQTMRMIYVRDAAATGGVSIFDTIFTATPVINSNAPYTLIGLNMEAPTVAPGKTLATFYGALIGAGGGGTVSSRYALVTAPGAGNVGINTTTPFAPLHLVADNLGSSDRAAQMVVQGSSNPNLKLNLGIHTEVSPAYADLGFVEEGVAWRNLVLARNGGAVGIGTTTPTSPLTVNGIIQSTTGGFKFPDGSMLTSAVNNFTQTSYTSSTPDQVIHATQNGAGAGSLTLATLPTAIRGDSSTTTNFTSGILGTSSSGSGFGVVGENFAATGYAIGVFGVSTQSANATGVWGEAQGTGANAVGVYGKSPSTAGTGVLGYASATSGDAAGVYGRSDSTFGLGVWGDSTATSGNTFGVLGRVASGSGAAGVFDNTAAGNILLGRTGTNPVNVFRVDGTGRGFFNGNVQVGGADFAESFEVVGTKSTYEAGDLLIIDQSKDRRLALSYEPYSTLVAGIYSTKPGVLATPHDITSTEVDAEVPLAVVGIVPCKASAENGRIHRGDLLVSSSIAGHVMKGTDRSRMLGAVVGKALSNLDSGSGMIQVLVTLQ